MKHNAIRRMMRRYPMIGALIWAIVNMLIDFRPAVGWRVSRSLGVPMVSGGDGTPTTVKEAREAAVAAGKAFDDYCKEIKLEDANELETDKYSAEQRTKFNGLYQAFTDADALFVELEKKDVNGRKRMSVRDRLSYYTEAIQGHPMRFDKIAEAPASIGQQFTESDSYKALLERGAFDRDHMSHEMDPVQYKMAATDIIGTTTGDPAAGLVTPMLLPGILPLPQRPLTVRELFSNAPMTQGDTIEYAAQVAFDSAAAAVSQAAADGNPTGAKPQSSIAWERRSARAEQLATWMAVTRQTLQDAAQVRSLIDNQGRLMLQLLEEDQILSGSGVTPQLVGLDITPGVQTYDLTGVDELGNLKGVRVAKRLVKTGLSRLTADAIVLNPEDSEAFDLMTTATEKIFRAGDPFGAFPDAAPIWRLRRVESEAIAQGTGIVGAFRAGATVFERQPITVYTSDSHSDFFIRNLIAVLFEERIAFPVFFPSAFVMITFGDFTPFESGTIDVLT